MDTQEYKLQQIRTDRLLTLANWLRDHQIDNIPIEYSKTKVKYVPNQIDIELLIRPVLALPLIFHEWTRDKEGNVVCIDDKHQNTLTSLIFFFGIHPNFVWHLFITNSQDIENIGGKVLTNLSPVKDVAENIEVFVSLILKHVDN